MSSFLGSAIARRTLTAASTRSTRARARVPTPGWGPPSSHKATLARIACRVCHERGSSPRRCIPTASVRWVRRTTADLLLLVTVTLWALNFTVSKYILDHGFRPLSYASVRYATAAGLFTAITYPREGSLRINRSDLPL